MSVRPRRAGLALAALWLAGSLVAADASARKFQMSGTWVYRTGSAFLPLQFAALAKDATGNPINASMGDLSEAFGTPNGPIPGEGVVTAIGSAPATLRVPPHRFVEEAMTLVPLGGGTCCVRPP